MFQSFKTSRSRLPKNKIYIFKGSKMSYSIIGKGPAIVLLHGSMTSDPWKGFEKELAKYYKVYLPHLPGFGASETVNNRLHNTELFSEAFSLFIKNTQLEKAPIIAFSLGTVVAVKAVSKGCSDGKLILIGMPLRISSEKLKIASLIPIWVRRILGSTIWGRSKILIPILRDVIGIADKKRNAQLLKELKTTDTRALVDLDPYKEVESQMPKLLKKLKNEVIYIYGANDKLLKTSKSLIKNPIIIKEADHNVFRSQPKNTLNILKRHIIKKAPNRKSGRRYKP